MRTIILYFRQVFCKHEFEREERFVEVNDDFGYHKQGIKESIYCTKCGFHKKFWKY